MSKRILAMLLAVLMIISMLPVSAFAEEEILDEIILDDVVEVASEEATETVETTTDALPVVEAIEILSRPCG